MKRCYEGFEQYFDWRRKIRKNGKGRKELECIFTDKNYQFASCFKMPMDWRAHPVAHCGTTKRGSKPNHPKGDRRPNDQFARFISESYGMVDETDRPLTGYRLCRTCYEREYAEYNSSKARRTTIEADADETMDVDDESTENGRQFNSTTNDLSMADYQMDEDLESSTPESFTESEDSDDMEHGYRHQQAKDVLNQVFQALNIPKIVDM